jgi:uncharacterized protein (DUF2236 family)
VHAADFASISAEKPHVAATRMLHGRLSRTMDEREPLGPGSVTWKYFGDRRGILLGLWMGVLQNMHPQVAAGVEQHSQFSAERWQRTLRSVYPILGVVYDGPHARHTARQIVGYHRGVSGTDTRGRRYHALNRDPFYWAHLTFVMANVVIAEYFDTPLTRAQKERLARESVQWYRLYGLPAHDLPQDWTALRSHWDSTCAEVLEDCKAARDVLDIARIARPPLLRPVPQLLWQAMWRPASLLLTWMTVGFLPPVVRERLGLEWSAREARLLRLLCRAASVPFLLLPFPLRYHPRARAGWRRAHGTIPATAPLVHTPARYLPPLARRTHPSHYAGSLYQHSARP